MGLRDGGYALGQVAAGVIGREADGRLDDPTLRARIADYEIRAAAFRCLSERFTDEWKAGIAHPAQSSVMKYLGTELAKLRHELMMLAQGTDALAWEGERSQEGAAARAWLRSRGNSIEGGTSEIQLNIIAKRILALPRA
jgi:alkylation response protein AidB-like acyl-CoA dehydrogenase